MSSSTTFFTPLQIGDLTISNRVGISALKRNRAADSGIPTELMAEYHAQRAAGVIISQGTLITPCGMCFKYGDGDLSSFGATSIATNHMFAILHCLGLGECLSRFLLTLAMYIYLCVVTAVWALCQPLFCVGLCFIFPEASPTELKFMMFTLYTSSIIFAYWTMGLAGPIPIIGGVLFFGVMVYITIIDHSFCSTFMQHGQHQFSTKEGAAMTEGNALDVESWPQGHVVDDILPYSRQYSPLPHAQVY